MALCSIGIALGAVAMFGLAKRFFWRRRFGRHGCGHGHRRGLGRSYWLRAIFSRLDTTPGQEREIRSAIEDFQKAAREAKDGLKGAREDLARAIRGDVFDDLAVGDAGGRADATAARIKDAFASTLKRVHAVLDANQRERLAELLAKGPPRWGNPYRDAAF